MSTPTRDDTRNQQQDDNSQEHQTDLSGQEQRQTNDRAPVSALVVQQVIREEGERELERSAAALLCSALAAGLSMGFSLVAVLNYGQVIGEQKNESS